MYVSFILNVFDIALSIRKGNMQVIAAHLKHKQNIQHKNLR